MCSTQDWGDIYLDSNMGQARSRDRNHVLVKFRQIEEGIFEMNFEIIFRRQALGFPMKGK